MPAKIQNIVSSKCAINADDISETYEDLPTGKVQMRRFQRPHPGLKTLLQETLRISANDFYSQKLQLLTYIPATDSTGLCLFIFTQLSLKAEPPESKTSGTKTEFGVK